MSKETSPASRIGQILKSLRLKHGLSQLEVSLRCEISPRHYQEIEYGRKNCQINTLTKILKIYEVNIFSFFTSFFIDEFQKNGVDVLYQIFGDRAFGYRKFNLEGTVTYQCKYSVEITGMTDDQVIGKMKVWSDLEDPAMAIFVKTSLKYFINLLPTPPSWKVAIKNHATNTSHPFLGFCRYDRNKKNKVIGLDIIIFPLDEV